MTQLARLSHDMKTPLSAISLYNDRLRNMKPNDPDRDACHEVISDQINRLVHITRSVLEQSRQSVGDDHVDIAVLLQDMVSIYENLHPDYSFVLLLPSDLPLIMGDAPALGRVLTNLLDNAVAYSHPTEIVIAAALQSDGIQLRIRDRGCGISARTLPHIFKPRFRGSSTVPGNGMGLAIVQDIIHAHGGRVEVASTAGVGTVIRIILPHSILVDLP